MGCTSICVKYKARKPTNMGRYVAGQKRCQICDVFIMWDGPRCPCCNYTLRVRARNKKGQLDNEKNITRL